MEETFLEVAASTREKYGGPPPPRLSPGEIAACFHFSAKYGIPALLDHMGLDLLANQVNGMISNDRR